MANSAGMRWLCSRGDGLRRFRRLNHFQPFVGAQESFPAVNGDVENPGL